MSDHTIRYHRPVVVGVGRRYACRLQPSPKRSPNRIPPSSSTRRKGRSCERFSIGAKRHAGK